MEWVNRSQNADEAPGLVDWPEQSRHAWTLQVEKEPKPAESVNRALFTQGGPVKGRDEPMTRGTVTNRSCYLLDAGLPCGGRSERRGFVRHDGPPLHVKKSCSVPRNNVDLTGMSQGRLILLPIRSMEVSGPIIGRVRATSLPWKKRTFPCLPGCISIQ